LQFVCYAEGTLTSVQ